MRLYIILVTFLLSFEVSKKFSGEYFESSLCKQ